MATIPLKELRNKKGMTQADLSALLSVSPSTVGMWEQGRREPDYEYLTRIADIFEVSADYLLGRSEANRSKVLSPEHMRLLEAYDSLGKDGQSLLNGIMNSLLVSHAKKSPKKITHNGGNNFLNVGGGTNYVRTI